MSREPGTEPPAWVVVEFDLADDPDERQTVRAWTATEAAREFADNHWTGDPPREGETLDVLVFAADGARRFTVAAEYHLYLRAREVR